LNFKLFELSLLGWKDSTVRITTVWNYPISTLSDFYSRSSLHKGEAMWQRMDKGYVGLLRSTICKCFFHQ
jgi:hypothetical protein